MPKEKAQGGRRIRLLPAVLAGLLLALPSCRSNRKTQAVALGIGAAALAAGIAYTIAKPSSTTLDLN